MYIYTIYIYTFIDNTNSMYIYIHMDIQYPISMTAIYQKGIPLPPTPPHAAPRPVCGGPGMGGVGVNPLWVYSHIGYRILDIYLHMYIHICVYFIFFNEVCYPHIYIYIYIYTVYVYVPDRRGTKTMQTNSGISS